MRIVGWSSGGCSSDLVPALFGPGYESTASIVTMLSPWLLLFALHQALATRLTASDRQSSRVFIEGTGLLLVVVLNILLLPRFGPAGAVAGLLTAEACMVLGCWLFLVRSEKHTSELQ